MTESAYTILETLCEHDGVTTYKAEDETTRELVVLKVFEISPGLPREEVEKFLQVASTLQSNPHPNLNRVIASWMDSDAGYVATAWLDAGSLIDEIETGLTVAQLAKVMGDVVSALDHIHQLGIVHGDVKPTNILVDEHYRGVLVDLDGAAFSGPESRLRLFTLGYASPECLSHQRVEPSSDIYSFGTTLYRVLVGDMPWYDELGEPRSMAEDDTIPTLPVQHAVFQRVIHRALAFHPPERSFDMDALVKTFGEIRDDDVLPPRVIRADAISSRELELVMPPIDDESVVRPDRSRPRRRGNLRPFLGVSASLLLFCALILGFHERERIVELLAFAGIGDHPELQSRELAAATIRADPNQRLGAILAAYNRVLEIDPDNALAQQAIPTIKDEWKSKISLAIDNNELQRARLQLDDLLEQDPNDTEVRLLYTRLDARQRAIRLLDDTRVLIERTGIENQSTAAIALLAYRQVIDLYPDSEEATTQLDVLAGQYAELAVSAVQADDLTTAMAHLGDAVTANPDHPDLDNVRTLISQAETLKSEIEDMLQRASDYRLAGQLITPSGNNAAELYHQVLATDPENAVAAQGLSEVNAQIVVGVERLLEQRNLAEVQELLEQSTTVGLSPDSIGEMRAQLDELLDRISQAATLHVEAESLFNMGYITEPVDQNAVSLLREAVRLDSKNINASDLLERCAERLAEVARDAKEANMDDEARLYLELALTVSPETTEWQRLRDSWYASET